MDWATRLAFLSGSVGEERLLRNQPPAPRGQGRGRRVGDRLVMDASARGVVQTEDEEQRIHE